MDVAVFESTNSHASNLLIGEMYDKKLTESIQELVDQYDKGFSDFSASRSVFFELMQARVDPSLESVWFFTGLCFQNRKSEEDDLLHRVSTSTDIFQFLLACSSSCCGPKSIALLAPLIFEICAIVVKIWQKDTSSKSEKEAMRGIEPLIEGILGFVSVCYFNVSNKEDNTSIDLVSSLVNSLRLWANHGFNENGDSMRNLKYLFPLVSDEIRKPLSEGDINISYLAGVVTLEVFLLQICLKLRGGVSRSELQNDLRTWAVGSISSFQSYCFFDILVRMLLEPNLPVTFLLCSEDELLVREIIYDAVILVDYSFLKAEREIEVFTESTTRLIITRLIVTHEAIEFCRKNGDPTKAVSYSNAFSSSSLPFLLTKWITSQFETEANLARPNGSSPNAIIRWFLELENEGIPIFDNTVLSKQHLKLIDREENKNADLEAAFYIDNKGEHEREHEGTNKSVDTKNEDAGASAAFVAASHEMKGSHRKRRMGGSVEKQQERVKFFKYNIHDIPESFPGPEIISDLINGEEMENHHQSESDEEDTPLI